jgi:fido (protein-threonine AMPylation protein)
VQPNRRIATGPPKDIKAYLKCSVRVVLGHFIFVYIHPCMDGNGRMGRLLMNVMLAGGGYPWTVVPLEKR